MSTDSGRSVVLYSPRVLAVYLVISAALGMFLYALNVKRRGARPLGWLLILVSVLLLAIRIWLLATGTRIIWFSVVGIVAAIVMYNVEKDPYELAVHNGASTARWWPPVFGLIGISMFAALF